MLYTFILVLCMPDSPQCFRMEPYAESMSQCIELRKSVIERFKGLDFKVEECTEEDVD